MYANHESNMQQGLHEPAVHRCSTVFLLIGGSVVIIIIITGHHEALVLHRIRQVANEITTIDLLEGHARGVSQEPDYVNLFKYAGLDPSILSSLAQKRNSGNDLHSLNDALIATPSRE